MGYAASRLARLFREHPDMLREVLHALDRVPTCEGVEGPCDRTDVRLVPSYTQYAPSEENPYPNQSHFLCPECEQRYHEHWKSMLADYYWDRL